MTTRTRLVDRAAHRLDADLHRVRLDLRTARRAAGLSCDTIGLMSGVDGSTIARIESGEIQQTDLRSLARFAAAVGLELRLRSYLIGDPIRDAGQQRLLARLRSQLHPTLGWSTEVGLPIGGDLRAWDAVIRGASWSVGVEAETVLDDLQAVDRRLALKRRDGGLDRALLLVADTRRNRAALVAAPAAFADLDRDARAVLAAFRAERDPGCDAIVLL